jgi:hypothetical protein
MRMKHLDKVRSLLSIFQGDCSELECPVGQQQDYWVAQKGVEYRFLVYGYGYYLGDYSLLFHEVDDLPSNHNCASATAITSAVYNTSGSLDGALPVDSKLRTLCRRRVPMRENAQGVWFSYTGKGETVRMRVDEHLDKVRSSLLSIFQGDCSELECPVREQQDFWVAQKGVEYRFLVYGYGYGNGYGDYRDYLHDYRLDYSLLFHEVELPPNHNCASATAITSAVYNASGSLDGALPVDSSKLRKLCRTNFVNANAQGVWFSYTGKGGRVRMRMESLDEVRSSRLAFFQGDCSELKCPAVAVAQEDYWVAQKGVEYRFLVYSYGDYRGDYSLLFHEVDE